ncbi:MAG: hypothetical protein D6B26_02270 [Spirochaetaceae bacterium]|nr:MAG: hypothetical protein D6B26_02270 [Spirochaetaceae bacterium]
MDRKMRVAGARIVLGLVVLCLGGTLAGAQELLLSDDFANNDMDWYVSDSIQVANGRYEFSNDEHADYTWMSGNMADGSVVADSVWLGGDETMGYGLVFRLVDAQNFYFLWITANGQFTVGKVMENHAVPIKQWSSSDAINTRGENHLRVEFSGYLINILINGQEVVVLRDDTFTEGGYGFYVHRGAHVAFDNMRVVADSPFTLHMPRNGSMERFRGMLGKTFSLTLTGDASGKIWGTDVYTDDSNIAAAAVHSGALADGETGTVIITILPGQESYAESERNGVSSQSYRSWHGSYKVERIQ